jgi:hypothetical protein
VISFAQGETPGSVMPDIIDPADWIIFAFRLEASPLVIAPDSAADRRRIVQWIEVHPEQLELYEHALMVVFGCDTFDDFLRLGEEDEE